MCGVSMKSNIKIWCLSLGLLLESLPVSGNTVIIPTKPLPGKDVPRFLGGLTGVLRGTFKVASAYNYRHNKAHYRATKGGAYLVCMMNDLISLYDDKNVHLSYHQVTRLVHDITSLITLYVDGDEQGALISEAVAEGEEMDPIVALASLLSLVESYTSLYVTFHNNHTITSQKEFNTVQTCKGVLSIAHYLNEALVSGHDSWALFIRLGLALESCLLMLYQDAHSAAGHVLIKPIEQLRDMHKKAVEGDLKRLNNKGSGYFSKKLTKRDLKYAESLYKDRAFSLKYNKHCHAIFCFAKKKKEYDIMMAMDQLRNHWENMTQWDLIALTFSHPPVLEARENPVQDRVKAMFRYCNHAQEFIDACLDLARKYKEQIPDLKEVIDMTQKRREALIKVLHQLGKNSD